MPAVGTLPLAQDLGSEAWQAQARGEPLVLLVSRSDCEFCHEVRVSYLAPLWREQSLPIEELVSDYTNPVKLFDGQTSTHTKAASILKISFFPTVLFLNANGAALAPALVGANKAGFYAAYLDQSLQAAREALKNRRL
jgi:thioredoxin-related protein